MSHSRRIATLALLLVMVLTLSLGTGPNAAQAQGKSGDIIPGHYIVTLSEGVDSLAYVQGLARANDIAIEHIYSHAMNGFAGVISDKQLDALKSDPNVLAIEPDRIVTLERFRQERPTSFGPGLFEVAAQSLPTGINRIDGELSSTLAGNGSGAVNVDVAVIDTGIDPSHVDLNVVGGKNCSTGNTYNDGNGHGSHVAGTIGARDDGNGVVGVAPGARLWAVRVLNNAGSGSTSSVVCGIDWVTANAGTIEVANMSLGGSGGDSSTGTNCNGPSAYHNAICKSVKAGVTYAVAAGNSSADSRNYVPAAFDEVITVSALADFNGAPGGGAAATCRADVDDTFADFSNYGADIDIIAPGVCIHSTWKGGGYNTISGTSMATPHVAGAAALYKATNPSATPSQVKSALQTAGNLNWNNADDRDSTKEPLLNVAGF
jgi:subtilisin